MSADPPPQAVLDNGQHATERGVPLGRRAWVARPQHGILAVEGTAGLSGIGLQRRVTQQRVQAMLLDGCTITRLRQTLQPGERNGKVFVARIIRQPQPQRQERLVDLPQRQRAAQFQRRVACRGHSPRQEQFVPPLAPFPQVTERAG